MAEAPTSTWLERLGAIDRRWLYAGLVVFTLIPLLISMPLPTFTTRPVQEFYDVVEAAPADELVFVASNWDAGTLAESEPQAEAIFRHLIRKQLRFVVFSVGSPNAPQLVQNVIDDAIQQEAAARGSAVVYGADYVNTGFKVMNPAWVRSLVNNPVGTLEKDWKGIDLATMPIFQGVSRMPGSTYLLVDITGSNTIAAWVAYVRPEGIKVSLACTAVMAPEQYPLLASGQLSGLLTGMRGAVEYRGLLDIEGKVDQQMDGQSFAHVYIVLLIIAGNLAVVLARRGRRGATH